MLPPLTRATACSFLCLTFLLAAQAQDFTKLVDFNGANGRAPFDGLVQAKDGNFYGTTYGGGTGAGNIFKMTPAGAVTSLYSFTAGKDGYDPIGGLVQATNGNFYGTTSSGGSHGGGTVFEITPSGTLTTLYASAWNLAVLMVLSHLLLWCRRPTGISTEQQSMAAVPLYVVWMVVVAQSSGSRPMARSLRCTNSALSPPVPTGPFRRET